MIHEIHFTNNLWVLAVPCVLMAIDFATGFLNAWARREVQSAKMRTGLAKKIGEIAALLAVKTCAEGMAIPSEVMTGVSLYIVTMELLSITENLALLGVPVPKRARDKLKNVRDDLGSNKYEWAKIEHSATEDSDHGEKTRTEHPNDNL